MAFQRQSGDPYDHLADINVTPLVDVMLVLLIIFMVTAPMLHQGVAVALPEDGDDEPAVERRRPDHPVDHARRASTTSTRRPWPADLLKERLGAFLRTRKDRTVFLKADRALSYGTVVETLDVLNRMGIENLGMITETPTNRKNEPLARWTPSGQILAEREHERLSRGRPALPWPSSSTPASAAGS